MERKERPGSRREGKSESEVRGKNNLREDLSMRYGKSTRRW